MAMHSHEALVETVRRMNWKFGRGEVVNVAAGFVFIRVPITQERSVTDRKRFEVLPGDKVRFLGRVRKIRPTTP